MAVVQSGNVTPGHLVKFAADNVIKDGGPSPYSQRVLASLLNADFNTTADQAIALDPSLNYFQLTGIVVAGASVSLSVAAGGFYPQASKGGTTIVASGQVYSALTTNTLLMQPTLSSYAQQQYFSRSQLPDWAVYLSLTTPQGGAALANVYLLGIELG